MTKKTVLITGCSTGFGKLAAKKFQAQGWTVAATMRSPEREKELTQLDQVLVTRLDVTDQESVTRATSDILDQLGRIDVLVNNAGFGTNGLLEQVQSDATRALFETNLFGVINVTRAVLPHMRHAGSGRLINVTSMAGLMGLPGNSLYCASKYAVEGLTESLDLECRAFNIRAMTVAPGAYSSTSFLSNVESMIDAGDAQLQAYSKSLRAHFAQLAHGDAPPQDPKEVANKIYDCATKDMPTHNPVGGDAVGIYKLMNGVDDRQVFIDLMAERLLPCEQSDADE